MLRVSGNPKNTVSSSFAVQLFCNKVDRPRSFWGRKTRSTPSEDRSSLVNRSSVATMFGSFGGVQRIVANGLGRTLFSTSAKRIVKKGVVSPILPFPEHVMRPNHATEKSMSGTITVLNDEVGETGLALERV